MKTILNKDLSFKLQSQLIQRSKLKAGDSLYVSSGFKSLSISIPYQAPGKIISNVYLVGGAGSSASFDCFVYLVDCGDSMLLIDSGTQNGVKKIINNIRKLKLDPKKIDTLFLTHGHYDHADGASGFKGFCNCTILIHEKDLDALTGKHIEKTAAKYLGDESFHSIDPDIVVKDNYRFTMNNIDFKVIHLPGHTPGNSGLLTKINNKTILFAGDILGWISEKWGSDLHELENSINRIIGLKPDIYATGHGWYKEDDLEYQFKLMKAMSEDKVLDLVLTKNHKLF